LNIETERLEFAQALMGESLSPRERVATAGRGFGRSETQWPARTLSPDPSPGGEGRRAFAKYP
jgi:hypothetical protein